MRALSDNSCLQILGTATTAEIQIDDVYFTVKHIPNDDLKCRVMKTIQDMSNAFVTILYRKKELHELPSLTHGSTREIWTIKRVVKKRIPDLW